MKIWIEEHGHTDHKNVLLEVLRERIPVEEAPDGLTISLVMDPAMGPGESYRVDKADGGFVITGTDRLGLYYGIGKLLHTAHWTADSFAPKTTDGVISPDCPYRIVYFCTHFYNWYNLAPVEELEKYARDLLLWGYNIAHCTISTSIYDSMEDPRVTTLFNKIRRILTIAKKFGMKTSFGGAVNQGLNSAPREIHGDNSCYDHRCKITGVNICPELPGGLDYLLNSWRDRFELLKDIGPDYIAFWPYDEGGCGCEKCRPWGANGYPKLCRSIAKLAREYFPNVKFQVSTWFFDQSVDEGEYEGFYRRIDNGELDFIDHLLSDSHQGLPPYLKTHTPPLPTIGFPEISMYALRPWGGRGANPLPRWFQKQWDECKHIMLGGKPYTESIYEDISKIQYIGYYWDKDRHYTDILWEYINYEYAAPELYAEILELIHLIEDNHMGVKDNLEPDMVKARRAVELAEYVDARLGQMAKTGFRWRLLYIRAKLDLMVYEYYHSKGRDYYLVNDTGRRWKDSDGTMVEPGGMISALGALWRTPISYLENNPEAQELMWELVAWYHSDLEKGTDSVMCPPLVINEETKRAHGYI